MKLLNFSLSNPVHESTLLGLDVEWDLHNFAEFMGFTFDPVEDCLRMEWSVPQVDNPWGWTENRAKGCALRFNKVKWVEITDREGNSEKSEDACLLGISRVIPDKSEYRFKKDWQADEPFHLLFQFESGRAIEVASDTVELEVVERKT